MNLNDQHIAITGAARGLGFAIAQSLLQKGARISVIDIDEHAVEKAVDALSAFGEVKGYTANVADESSVENLFEQMKSDWDELNGIVNNAGILRDGLLVKEKEGVISKMSLSQWQAVIDVNLTGVFLCGREAAQWMLEKKNEGVIVNISSISRAGNIGQSNYSAAKAGVSALTVAWAKELSRFGIRVADVAPGFIETEMTASMKEEAKARASNLVPLKRWGKPDNIARAVAFIFENDYFSGRTLEVDAALRI